MSKEVVFVRGSKTHQSLPWMFFHFHPHRDDQKVTPVRLTYFDYPAGTVSTWASWKPLRSKTKPRSTPAMESPISPTVQIRLADMSVTSNPPDPPQPSILAVYDYIKSRPAGSVLSLQVFSHGFADGPIIWMEAFEDAPKDDLTADRDTHDTEPRPRDFFGKNPLAGAEGRKFAAAFTQDAFVKMWGCTEDQKYRKLINDHRKLGTSLPDRAKRLALVQAYLGMIDELYALNMARLIGRPVFSAPLGWGSNPWGNEPYRTTFPPRIGRDRWWIVPAFSKPYRVFYARVLGASFDACRYVGYHNSWFQKASKEAAQEDADIKALIGATP